LKRISTPTPKRVLPIVVQALLAPKTPSENKLKKFAKKFISNHMLKNASLIF
jgi:hypothetical protein